MFESSLRLPKLLRLFWGGFFAILFAGAAMIKPILDIWQSVSGLPFYDIALFIAGILLAGASIASILYNIRQSTYTLTKAPILLEDREQLTKERGTFIEEISKEKAIWISTWIGSNLHENPALWKLKIIRRLVLTHPDYPLLGVYANLDMYADTSTYKKDIVKTTKIAMENGVDVWWYERPLFDGMVIANPELNGVKQWVRLEQFITNTFSGQSANIIAKANSYPIIYEQCVNSFNHMINAIEQQEGKSNSIGCKVTKVELNSWVNKLELNDTATGGKDNI